jgi:hypothetical protein
MVDKYNEYNKYNIHYISVYMTDDEKFKIIVEIKDDNDKYQIIAEKYYKSINGAYNFIIKTLED